MNNNKEINFFKILFQPGTGYFLFGITFILYLFTLTFDIPRTDDDYIGEQVYWLNKLSYVKSELMRGYGNIGLENLQTVYHKLFIFQGTAFAKIFGWSLPVLHAVSLFYTALFFIILFYFLKSKFENYKSYFLFIVVIMLLHHDFSFYSCTYRPEVMQMTLGFISYIFLDKFLNRKNKSHLILAGAFAGLAFLTHLNGLIFMMAGFLLLVINRQYLNSIWFGMVGTFVFTFYFLDILVYSSLEFFWMQFSNDPSLHKSNFNILSPLIKVIDEPMRFFHGPKEVLFAVPLLLAIVLGFTHFKREYKNLLIYTLILIFTLSVYTYSKTTKYIILYMPFLMILFAIGWDYVERERGAILKNLLRLTIVLYLVGGGWLMFSRAYENTFQSGSMIAENNETGSFLEGDSLNVIAPGNYIFHQIDSDQRIMNIHRFIFFVDSHDLPRMTFNQFLDSVEFYNIDYVIMDPPHQEYFNVQNHPLLRERCEKVISNGSRMILKLNGKP